MGGAKTAERGSMRRHPLLVVAVVVGLISPLTSQAQQTRTEALTEQVTQKKAKHATAPKPNKIEALLLRVEKQKPGGPKKDGWYPKFGGLAPGAGLALGAGYRQTLPFANAKSDLFGSYSLRGYQRLQGYVTVPAVGGSPLELRTGIRYRDLPRERFYGLGQRAAFGDRTSFALRDIDYTVALAAPIGRGFKAGIETGYLVHALRPGTYDRAPTLQERFSDLDAPGLGAHPDFLHTMVFVEHDSTDFPGYPREGGQYRTALGRFHDVGADGFSFKRFEAEAHHYFPFFNKRRVIALRGLVVMSDPDSGNEVPFYLMPTLGGSKWLRGYDLARFRDRHAMVLGAEYRWEVFAALDMALFVDAGKVAREIGQLGFNDLEVTPGIGFRFATTETLALRFDIARGRDGAVYHFMFGKSW